LLKIEEQIKNNPSLRSQHKNEVLLKLIAYLTSRYNSIFGYKLRTD